MLLVVCMQYMSHILNNYKKCVAVHGTPIKNFNDHSYLLLRSSSITTYPFHALKRPLFRPKNFLSFYQFSIQHLSMDLLTSAKMYGSRRALADDSDILWLSLLWTGTTKRTYVVVHEQLYREELKTCMRVR